MYRQTKVLIEFLSNQVSIGDGNRCQMTRNDGIYTARLTPRVDAFIKEKKMLFPYMFHTYLCLGGVKDALC